MVLTIIIIKIPHRPPQEQNELTLKISKCTTHHRCPWFFFQGEGQTDPLVNSFVKGGGVYSYDLGGRFTEF